MIARTLSLALLPMALAAGLASARDTPSVAPGSPAAVVAARQSAFSMSNAVFGALRLRSQAGESPREMQFGAQALARWAHALPGTFSDGTGADAVPSSHAAAAIWTDRATFDQRAADYAAATDRLAALAQADDKDGFAAQLGAVQQTCGACHSTFRTQRPRS